MPVLIFDAEAEQIYCTRCNQHLGVSSLDELDEICPKCGAIDYHVDDVALPELEKQVERSVTMAACELPKGSAVVTVVSSATTFFIESNFKNQSPEMLAEYFEGVAHQVRQRIAEEAKKNG